MTAQTALSWFLRAWMTLGGNTADMIEAMAAFLNDVQSELKRKNAQEARR